MNKVLSITATALTGSMLLAGCAPQEEWDIYQSPEAINTESTNNEETFGSIQTDQVELGDASQEQTAVLLRYLIEEEKLAHDVYTVLYEEFGSQVFGNILKSESKHQDSVLVLLEAYGIEDPRSEELGVFTDPELQALYDSLIAKGMLSETDAYEVGVRIEEKDIADITEQLETASDVDVIETLERLRSGSENHLRAFNKQL